MKIDSRIPPAIVMLLILIAMAIQIGVQYNYLPNPSPSHWNGNGQVDGYMSPGALVGMYAGIMCGMALLFGTMGLWFPKISPEYANVPNKSHWLSHREEFHEMMRTSSSFMMWAGCVVMLYILAVFQGNFNSAITGQPLSMVLVLVGMIIMLVLMFLCIGLMIRHMLQAGKKSGAKPADAWLPA